jgi:hypothetical protein
VNEKGYPPIPEGPYRSKIVEVKTNCTSSKGNEQWKIRWEISEGTYRGRLLFDDFTFSEGGLKKVKLVCDRIGIDVTGEVELTADMLLGKEAIVTTFHEPYDGQIRNKIGFDGYESVLPRNEDGEEPPF